MSTQLIHRRHLKQYIGDAKSILDVGCGNKPLRVATCIADKFPDTYTHKGKVHTENQDVAWGEVCRSDASTVTV